MCSETVSRRSAAATLRLNMLVVVFADAMQKDVVYSLPYSDELLRGGEAAVGRADN
jgi:hypothetical protein